MKKLITIIIGLLVVVASYGQTKVNKRIMLDSLNNKLAIRDTSAMLSNYALFSEVHADINDSIDARMGAGVELSDVAVMLTNETLYFAPVIGLGNAGDTTAFSLNDVIWGCKWDGDYSLTITKVTGVVYGSSPDIDIALWYDVNFRDGTPTEMLSGDLTITSTTARNDATSFASATIDPGEWIWITIEQQTSQPTQCIVNIYGYLVVTP